MATTRWTACGHRLRAHFVCVREVSHLTPVKRKVNLKVLYSGYYYDDGHPFNALCDNVQHARSEDDLKERDAALIIWGGADINPAYYGHPIHHTTHPGGARDRAEWSLMKRAIEMGITVIGVCRGAQMGCAASGGFLIQDVHGHIGRHDVLTYDGKRLAVNSIHHQMMCPEGVDHELVAWAENNLSAPYYGYRDGENYEPPANWREPEYVYFPKTRVHAIQWHPEMMASDAPATQYVLDFIKRKEDEHRNSGNYLSCAC